MPVRLSSLHSRLPISPTVGELKEHPEKYPEEIERWRSLAQRTVDVFNAQMRSVMAQGTEALHKAMLRDISSKLEAAMRESVKQFSIPIIPQDFPSISAILEKLLRPFGNALDILLPPGSIGRDLFEVREHRDMAAMRRLAARLKWWPKDPRAKQELRRRMAERGQEAYFEVFAPALLLAFERAKVPQRIRLGSEYFTDDTGKPVLLVPYNELPIILFHRWVKKETINFMEGILLDADQAVGWQDNKVVCFSELEGAGGVMDLENLTKEPVDPEEALLLAWTTQERAEMIERILAVASPQERRLLEFMLLEGMSLAETARAMGIKEATARVMWLNVRRKAEKIKSA